MKELVEILGQYDPYTELDWVIDEIRSKATDRTCIKAVALLNISHRIGDVINTIGRGNTHDFFKRYLIAY